jgi:hypothetical protein
VTWHPEVLAPRRQRVLARVGPLLTRHGFYLAGGTAVALHLGHRRSVDLDWFTAARLPDPLRLAQVRRDQVVAFITGSLIAQARAGSELPWRSASRRVTWRETSRPA